MRKNPTVSVIICTRDRGNQVFRTIDSVLKNHHCSYEVIIVDQSSDPIKSGAHHLLHNDLVRYCHSGDRGLSRARNLGARLSTGEIIAFTDDDCEVHDDWMDQIIAAFELSENIRMIFGSVFPADHDAEVGLIPHYFIHEPFLARSVRDRWRINGMGACMALRRSVWSELSGFDVCLGSGTPLQSAEETDLALRTLIAGHWIYQTPSIRVTHFGLVAKKRMRDLIAGYMLGTGAMFAKHARLRSKDIFSLVGGLVCQWLFKMPSIRYASSHKRLLRLWWFVCGFRAGMKIPLNRTSGHFIAQE